MNNGTISILVGLMIGSFASGAINLEMSPEEESQILKKLERIYSGGAVTPIESEVLNDRPLKYSILSGQKVEPNEVLRISGSSDELETFKKLAQQKLNPKFIQSQCHWLEERFVGLKCSSLGWDNSWEAIELQDRVEALTKTWLNRAQVTIDGLPRSGTTSLSLWSDDYWRLQWGATSYRYAGESDFSNYSEAVSSYAQPDFWLKTIANFSAAEISKNVVNWSPAEKYDLSTHNLDFGLTREQKEEGAKFVDENGDVESWMGICHGWAAASIIAPKPVKSVEFSGPEGIRVRWYPHDIRAITSLAWANGSYSSNFVGARCNSKKPETYPNGRLKESECFDNNPGTFHLALGNLVGLARASFVMDASFDYQVWNQPIHSYRFMYFNPLSPSQKSQDWREVAVDYNDKFKERDRFQNPLTRGKRNVETGIHDDSSIQKIVGVIATVVYLGEVAPIHGDSVREENLIRVTYTYDLELSQGDSGYKIIGGEWHTNAHPDFLWVPQKSSVAYTMIDSNGSEFTGNEIPSLGLIRDAKNASHFGYPLCSVVSKLLKSSSLESASVPYECRP